jgi:hypothetical protein
MSAPDHRLHTAKRPETKAKRMAVILAMLERGKDFEGRTSYSTTKGTSLEEKIPKAEPSDGSHVWDIRA